MTDLDEFQTTLARAIEQAKPQVYTVSEEAVWSRYNRPHLPLNPAPLRKMQEVAEALGCNVGVAVWSYVYKFWWGDWTAHPYSPGLRGPHDLSEVCKLRRPDGFYCHLPKGCHAELQDQ